MSFFVGLLVGSAITVFLMGMLTAGSKADNQMLGDRQYEE